MRGKQCGAPLLRLPTRITPAHAGKTSLISPKKSLLTGSPPRMRGKPMILQWSLMALRITPAHAGKTAIFATYQIEKPDHPRACGENLAKRLSFLRDRGSPPRMRGKPLLILDVQLVQRITPAHAGKTATALERVEDKSDHPRACGENEILERREGRRLGSPPRMRGKLWLLPLVYQHRRITPAHAGKTRLDSNFGILPPDHPRACGENMIHPRTKLVNNGSPPRMRGKRGRKYPADKHARITPAHAGKTSGTSIYAVP